MAAESWAPVPSLNNVYEASNTGFIRNAKTHKVLKPQKNRHGYSVLTVRPSPNCQVNVRIHRAVAEAFFGPCPKGMIVNHIDGNKANNSIDNLEYVTSAENNVHALKTGLRHPARDFSHVKRGEARKNAALTVDIVREIRRLHTENGWGCRKIAKAVNRDRGTVQNVLCGRTWNYVL